MGLFDDDNPTLKAIKHTLNDIGNFFTNGEPLKITGFFMGKGEFGEYAAEHVLNNLALTELSQIATLRNVYIETNGFTTEIDVIAVTEKGIFVLESKNYSGWIFGDMYSQNWMQTFKTGEKNRFYNPIKQNEAHIKKLAKYLDISPNCIFSYIVFSDDCSFKKIPPDTDHIHVIKCEELLWRMKDELLNGRTFFTPQDINDIYNKLLPLTMRTQEEKQKHVEEVQNLKSGTICPLCKKPLVVRRGPRGEFYGCSGYPNCKFTRNIN
ncbi:MAG: NERD domain-containing protein [Lachnospiraceae bacterium]|nr:NERD domain-containing protein [Lachnospiraceae bacterium]